MLGFALVDAGARRAGRCLPQAQAVAVVAARRLRCGARAEGARRNSLRSLRSLRSDRRRESVDEAREYARRPQPCAPHRPRQRLWQAPPGAQQPVLVFVGEQTPVVAKAGAVGWAWGACGAPRRRARTGTVRGTVPAWRAAGPQGPARPARPGFLARAHQHLTHGSCSSAAHEGRVASSAVGPRTRAPQGSRSEAQTAPDKPRTQPAAPAFARAEANAPCS
jgi:hypothetical protein